MVCRSCRMSGERQNQDSNRKSEKEMMPRSMSSWGNRRGGADR